MVWEERWHPLRGEWVIVAAHRQHRPWGGGTVEHTDEGEALLRRGRALQESSLMSHERTFDGSVS
jgi:galactose-1-phosphate uridylyltransferase